jgi:hypothetical protein
MFAKNKVTQSMLDAVNSVLNEDKKLLLEPGVKESSLKIPTGTGTKVLGRGYGNSAKAHEVQHKNPFEKGPSKKDLKGIKAPTKKELKSIGEEDLSEDGDCVTEPEAKKIAKKEVSHHNVTMHKGKKSTVKEGSFAHRLLSKVNEDKASAKDLETFTDNNMGEGKGLIGKQTKLDKNRNGKLDAQDFKMLRKEEEELTEEQLDEMINEVLSKDAPAGEWIHDFVHSDNPKFDGKSKAERKKMALGAYYGAQKEETEEMFVESVYTDKHTGYSTKSFTSGRRNYVEIHKDGEKVGRFEGGSGHLHGKNLPNINRYYDHGQDASKSGKLGRTHEAIHNFIKSKTGQEFISKSLHHATTGTGRTQSLNNPAPSRKELRQQAKADAHKKLMAGVKEEVEELGEAEAPKKMKDVSDKSWIKDAGKKPSKLRTFKSDLKNLGRFATGKKETNEAVETSQDKDAGKITTDMLTGRVPGGKLNSFKSFKTNLTTSGTQSIPTEIEKGEETKASEYHSTDPGPVDIKMDDKLSGTTTYTHSSKDKQVKTEEVKPELKKLRSKESKEQTHEISKFDNKVVQAKEEVEPINEDAWLNKYLLSKGINPNFVSQAVKISHAKSGAFMAWKQSHQNESVSVPFDKPYKSVSPVTTDKSGAKHTPISRAKDLARSALKKIKQDAGNEKA